MLTNAQLQAIKADILANPDLSAFTNNSDGNFAIAALYNLPNAQTWVVWKTEVSVQEIMSNGFVWTSVDALTVAKARIWEWMTRYGTINPSKPNIRQGIADCFGGASAMVTAILPHCKKQATRIQKLLSTGTGTDAVPATLATNLTDTFEIGYQDIQAARNLP